MRAHRSLIALLPLALLGACATPATTLSPSSPYVLAPSGSSYGLFLAGQAALHDGRSEEASEYFMRASAGGAMDGGFLKDRAFTAALLAGDIGKAASLAPVVPGDREATYRLGLLVKAVDLIARDKGRDARPLLSGDVLGFPHRPAAALLAPWAAAAAGDVQGSVTRPAVSGDRVVEYFGQLGQALLFERARRHDEAETDYKALASATELGGLFVTDYGAFLERQGRSREAVELYDGALSENPGEAELVAARARAASGGAAPALPTIREGAARALMAPAASMLAEKQAELALAYLRLALRLDPARDEAWVLVGDVLGATGDPQAAREAYAKVPSTSANFADARAKLAWSYQFEGDKEHAVQLAAEAATANPSDREAAITYADLLRANDRYGEAVQVLDRLIASAGETPDWRLLYMRGVALERAGRWPDAENDLKRALILQPEEPELLNYLGYTWIDRGERLDEALDMVRRASAANPHSGAMVDSLGWAHYRLGDYEEAVEKLERAAELEPADPEINHHLGDAYWRVGRRIEAQFQWRKVLTLEPTPATKTAVELKLESGLGPPPKRPGQIVAER
jgi:Flp pilus assembly protein TadD